MQKVDVQKKLAGFSEYWSPKVIAELNGQQVKVAKLLGEFEWHFHTQEDELFWVIEGCLEIHLGGAGKGGAVSRQTIRRHIPRDIAAGILQ